MADWKAGQIRLRCATITSTGAIHSLGPGPLPSAHGDLLMPKRRPVITLVGPLAVVLGLVFLFGSPARAAPSSRLNDHQVRTDTSGKLISWIAPQDRAYDEVLRLAWAWLLNSAPTVSNGLKAYYSYPYLDARRLAPANWPHNPAGAFAFLTESALLYYHYSGNVAPVTLAQQVLDYHLAHGLTPSTWIWPDMPYASSDPGATEYRGATDTSFSCCGRGDGVGVIEPDKSAQLGHALVMMYQFGGNTVYSSAAIRIADTLAARVRPGDSTHSPWPFRVYAQTDVVREQYTANAIAPIVLFDDLIRLNLGNVGAYTTARQTAWTWLMRYPIQNSTWSNYFEDVPIQSDLSNYNQLVANETAKYLLSHPEQDASWEADVRNILAWVERTFGKALYAGAMPIGEQIRFNNAMGSHTARYASVAALLYERTGDLAAREKAYRSYNWATYMAKDDGRVIDGPAVNQLWWTDGWGDYVRHFVVGMGAVPAWAPTGQNHMVRSVATVQSISYASRQITYRTSDNVSSERFRVSSAFIPDSVSVDGTRLAQRADLSADGWVYDAATGVLEVRHSTGRNVVISCGGCAA